MSEQATVLFDTPGPRARRRHVVLTVVSLIVFVAAVAAVIYGLRAQLAPQNWAPFLEGPTWTLYIFPGIVGTLQAALIAVVFASILGLILGAGRLSSNRLLSVPAGIFVEFFRSVPVLVMMIFIWAVFLFSGILSGPTLLLTAVVLGLTFYNGSVIAELLRSGVRSLPKGQREAGLAVGLTQRQTLTAVELPQAIRAMLPSLVSQLVVVLKDTALGSWIAYSELLRAADTLASVRGNLIPSYIVAAAIFILMNFSLTSFAQWLEKRMSRRTAGTPKAEAPGAVPV